VYAHKNSNPLSLLSEVEKMLVRIRTVIFDSYLVVSFLKYVNGFNLAGCGL
jgi:hypothetical protein